MYLVFAIENGESQEFQCQTTITPDSLSSADLFYWEPTLQVAYDCDFFNTEANTAASVSFKFGD